MSDDKTAARQVLLDLADRCEREEPSEYLASAILVAYGHQTLTRGSKLGWEYRPNGVGVWRAMPRPDLSLDAAVTLVPEGYDYDLSWYRHVANATVSLDGGEGEPDTFIGDGTAATPALALCAASLRARAEAL